MSSPDQDRRHVLKLVAVVAPTLAAGAWLGGSARRAVRTADGQFRFFSAPDGIHWAETAGTGSGIFLPLGPSFGLTPGSVSPRSGHLAYSALDRRTGSNIWTVPIHLRAGLPVAGTPVRFFHSGAFDVNPRFSPDGRQLSYDSREAGNWNFQVRSFPDAGHDQPMPRFSL